MALEGVGVGARLGADPARAALPRRGLAPGPRRRNFLRVRIFVGTSGFSYAPWRKTFYPEDLSPREYLRFYASRLGAVEINNTFYRLPSAKLLARWAGQVPPGFRFALKAPARITHVGALDPGDALQALLGAVGALGSNLGPLLFQLPPSHRADLPRLERFLGALPAGLSVAFEFRHASWHAPSVLGALAERGAALCISDVGGAIPPIASTARFGYLRLRRPDYLPADLERWATTVLAQPWHEAYVFFKHEDGAKGPRLADALGHWVERGAAPEAPPP